MSIDLSAMGLSTEPKADCHALFPRAFLIRTFEQRLLKLFGEGRLFGTVHTCIGQEFSGLAVASHLEPGDLIFSNHRCHGHYLARTGDADGLIAEIMGRTTGICGGRGGSQHICAGGVFSSGVQGGIMPVAAGLALAQQLAATRSIVVAFIGDGTLGEGVLYETLNVVSKWKIPLLTVLENNGYAQSTAFAQTVAGDIILRAESFGLRAYRSNTWDPEALVKLVGDVIGRVRDECSPAFVCIDTYRLMAHSKGDDDRPESERLHYWAIDPLTRFAAEHPDEAAGMQAAAETQVTRAVDKALDAEFAAPPPRDVPSSRELVWQRTLIDGQERVGARIYTALRAYLENDSRAFLLGEDIESPYGGAFKITRDLSCLFPSRVRNTPVSEAAIVGIATGLAMAGFRPVCEIMFGDFLALAADQIINHAAKFQWIYNEQVQVPLLIRTPMGGRRGYGATHSQSLEKHFLGLPGTRILAIHHRYDPCRLLERVFATIDRPTIVIENKALYGETVAGCASIGFWCEHTAEDFPTTRICSAATPDISIVCYGGVLIEAEKALERLFEERDIVAEIVCPQLLYPLAIDPIVESLAVSGRLLVVEEGQLFCGFGAELLAAVQEASGGLPLQMRRHAAASHPIPASRPAETESLPNADSIFRECVRMVIGD